LAAEAEELKMKKVVYGMGLVASVMFAVAIADAQTGGGSTGSGSSGTSASGRSAAGATATGSTGTSAAGSSGLGASSPSNVGTGGAGSSTATGTAAGRTGTGASSFQASPPGSAVTQPGLPGTRQIPGTRSGIGQSGLGQRSTVNQSDFTQRSAIERQRLIDQQQSPTLRTPGEFNQGQNQFNDQQSLQQRATLGEQQAAGRQDTLRDQSMLRGTLDQRTEQTLTMGTAPGELGVFVSPGTTRGVVVSRIVAGSAAATAGLQPGDIIVGVGDQMVSSPSDLTRLVRAIRAGEIAQLQVVRGDAEYDVDATLMAFRGQSSSSYDVGYRGSESTVGGDLSSRVRRLEEQLAMVLDELQTIRREVVVLRGGSSESAEFDSRFRAGETRGTAFEGSATRSEFDQRSTQSGLDTNATQRGPVSGLDAQSDTQIDARSSLPATQRSETDATNGGLDSTNRSAAPAATDDDPLGLNNDTSRPTTPPQNEPATGEQDQQQSETDSNQDLPF
jgi:hypothetical protein